MFKLASREHSVANNFPGFAASKSISFPPYFITPTDELPLATVYVKQFDQIAATRDKWHP